MVLYQIKKIKVRVSRQEVSDYFREQELARKVRFAQLITTSEDSAWAALREITSGRDFGEVAEQWSIHEPTMEQGGDTRSVCRQAGYAAPICAHPSSHL